MIFALSSKISDQGTLAKMSNYFLNISHIPTNMLTDFCKTFDINIILRIYDEKKGEIRKMNDKNGGIFGVKNASQSFNIAIFKLRNMELRIIGLWKNVGKLIRKQEIIMWLILTQLILQV